MRAVTAEEIEQIVFGLKKTRGITQRGRSARNSGVMHTDLGGVSLTGVTVTGYPSGTYSGPPPMGYSGYTGAPTGGHDGGGGSGSDVSYNDGDHNVYVTCGTSDNGTNNPGDIMWGEFADKWAGAKASSTTTSSGTLASFPSEQEGLDALADLLDHNYANNTIANFAATYTSTNPEAETQNVEAYMKEFGFTNTNVSISDMGDNEFNVFLNAVSVAEGHTKLC